MDGACDKLTCKTGGLSYQKMPRNFGVITDEDMLKYWTSLVTRSGKPPCNCREDPRTETATVQPSCSYVWKFEVSHVTLTLWFALIIDAGITHLLTSL